MDIGATIPEMGSCMTLLTVDGNQRLLLKHPVSNTAIASKLARMTPARRREVIQNKILTVAEAAAILGVSVQRTRLLVKSRRIAAFKPTGSKCWSVFFPISIQLAMRGPRLGQKPVRRLATVAKQDERR